MKVRQKLLYIFVWWFFFYWWVSGLGEGAEVEDGVLLQRGKAKWTGWRVRGRGGPVCN